MIEKHFTDDTKREGPDHKFSMSIESWREMVDRTRELEASLGSVVKKIEDNEKETVVLQRRSVRAKHNMQLGDIISKENIEILRPCPKDGLPPYEIPHIVGKILVNNITAGECINWADLK